MALSIFTELYSNYHNLRTFATPPKKKHIPYSCHCLPRPLAIHPQPSATASLPSLCRFVFSGHFTVDLYCGKHGRNCLEHKPVSNFEFKICLIFMFMNKTMFMKVRYGQEMKISKLFQHPLNISRKRKGKGVTEEGRQAVSYTSKDPPSLGSDSKERR